MDVKSASSGGQKPENHLRHNIIIIHCSIISKDTPVRVDFDQWL